MNLLQEYKELYFKEIEFKDAMSNKIGTSITLLTLLCTGHIYMLKIITNLQIVIQFLPIIFFIFYSISVCYTILTLYNFYKAYFKYLYKYVSIEGISEQINNNRGLVDSFSKNEIDEANENMLINTYLEHTLINRKENLRKNRNHMKLSASLVSAVLSLIISYIYWIIIINNHYF